MEEGGSPPMTFEEHQELLQRLRDINKRMGKERAKLEVKLEDLTVEARVCDRKRLLPTLLNTTINKFEDLMGWLNLHPEKRRLVKILESSTAVIKPSRMTLLLGPPRSGKSTFLRALSGKLNPNLKVTGKIMYNGQNMNHHVTQKMCAYVSQDDQHHAEMTVRETLEFSGLMLEAGKSFDMLKSGSTKMEKAGNSQEEIDDLETQSTSGEDWNLAMNYVLKVLGLEDCADIIIGDEMRRGISGGQKKRVTIGEMLVGLSQGFFMDDISTGLDSSTTFRILKFLQQLTHTLDLTMVISLLQPPQEIFELFDDIILLCEGQIAYQGPRADVHKFFESMGFKCPNRKNVADFLQEVVSRKDQAQFWIGNKTKYHFVPVKIFSDSVKSFCTGRLLKEKQQKPYNLAEHDQEETRLEERFVVQNWKIFKACFLREKLLMKRNSPVHIFKSIQITLLAFVVMTIFIRTEMNHQSIADGYRYMGAIFAGVIIVMFNAMTELSIMIRRLPIFYKQRELFLLPGWALLLSISILSLPMSFAETGLWTCLTYYVIGFAPTAFRFFQQFLALFCVHQMSTSLFRFIAVVGKTQLMANTLGTATLVAVYILGGFVISKDDIQPWLVWGYWMSPLTYGQNAVAINEFFDGRWSRKNISGEILTDTVGEAILRSRGMLTEWHWFWYSVGILLSFAALFNIFSILALEYLKAPSNNVNIKIWPKDVKKSAVADEQAAEETACNSMTLSFQPLNLAFSQINYHVDMPKKLKKRGMKGKKLQLLQDVSGVFRPGILTVLMGVTGAGKTTLLDVLAGRKTSGHVEGYISVSGYPKNQETFSRVSGYCEQTDNHSPYLTVTETLWYSACLRLPSHIDAHTRKMFINEVMDMVELKPLKNAMVGLPRENGLAAEARKRLTIAVELVSSPSIIFMDEPTTGLDARAAAIIMRTVRKIADTGRTIVCTIHQPSTEIFEAFDEMLLMKKGGQLIYAGSLGHFSQSMIQYFEAISGVPKIQEGQNPAAWMLDITSPAMEHKLGKDFRTVFQNSPLYRNNMELVDELNYRPSNSEDLNFESKHTTSFQKQCLYCLWKQHRSYWKNPEYNIVRFIITISISVLFGLVFLGIGSKMSDEQDIFNILGALYGSAMFIGFANANIVQPIVEMERTVFYRERAAGMYTSLPYAISQAAIEVPYILVQVIIFSIIVYPMIGFQLSLVKFSWFMLFIFFSFIYFTFFGMMAVSLTPNQEIAASFSFFIFLLWNIFSGFFISRKMIPVWWRWCYWVDPAAWTIYGLMVSQLGDNAELMHVAGSSDESVKEFLWDYFGLKDSFLPAVISVHVVTIIIFLFVFSFGFKYLNFQRR